MKNALPDRHTVLIERCRRERSELVATTAAMLASLPRARDARRWFRLARRLMRIAAMRD